ncbi:MAG: hypothetical protein JW850_04605 [Thermoflexales bacterium]|nr:hypothetical protein [Thermoflexales bacterium]
MNGIEFFKAETKEERDAINLFLLRHNKRGAGSKTGYVAYYAAITPDDGRPLVDRLVAAAKICPLHTPQAARFYAGDGWRHVYCLQRLAAYHAPENLLSKFLAWVLQEAGRDERIWYIATYADVGTFNDEIGRPHDGGIYRATNAVYCGRSGGGVEGFVLDGQRYSMRCGPKTRTVSELRDMNVQARLEGKPEPVRILRSAGMHRYCWPVGAPLQRAFRRRALEARMSGYTFAKRYQPRLLARLLNYLRLRQAAWMLLGAKA